MAERRRTKLLESKTDFDQPVCLLDADFEILCKGRTRIEIKPNGTKIITCEGPTIYREKKRDGWIRLYSEP